MKSYSESYKAAGVDITAGYTAVELMKQHVARTMTPGAIGSLGGFGGLFELDVTGMQHPVLVLSLIHILKIKDLGEDIREKTAWKQIRQAVTGLEQALASPDFTYNGRRYTERIDLDSFAVNYLLQELSKNRDFHNPYSSFLYERDGILYLSLIHISMPSLAMRQKLSMVSS